MSKIIPNLSRTFLILVFGLLFLFYSSAQEISKDNNVIEAGKSVFKANCSTCHEIHSVRIGPSLANIYERRSIEWLISWIRNSQALIASGDEEAVALFEEYNKQVMASYPFSDDEIMEILAYIQDETIKGPDKKEEVVTNQTEAADASDTISSTYLTAIVCTFVIILIVVLWILVVTVKTISKYAKKQKDVSEEDKELIHQTFDLMALVKSNAFVGFIVFIVIAIILKTLIDGAFTIGVQQGYQPTQPIAFSHKIHAGQYEIDCQYCHTGVRKSKSANIPSPNICMNCHTQIGIQSEEVQKIFKAVDYNPLTETYGSNTRPIEWVRIHNLPDLAYFNHSQHVAVAEIECQTCHGPIEEMDVVYQYSDLTMGWCINCHRETDVKAENNEYYTKLIQLHKKKGKKPMKVEDIGGLECAKCHY